MSHAETILKILEVGKTPVDEVVRTMEHGYGVAPSVTKMRLHAMKVQGQVVMDDGYVEIPTPKQT